MYRGDLERFIAVGGDPTTRVRTRAVPLSNATYPFEPMRIAADRLGQLDGLAVPVVDPGEPTHVIGFITREAPFDARIQWNELDQVRERVLSLSPARGLAGLAKSPFSDEGEAPSPPSEPLKATLRGMVRLRIFPPRAAGAPGERFPQGLDTHRTALAEADCGRA